MAQTTRGAGVAHRKWGAASFLALGLMLAPAVSVARSPPAGGVKDKAQIEANAEARHGSVIVDVKALLSATGSPEVKRPSKEATKADARIRPPRRGRVAGKPEHAKADAKAGARADIEQSQPPHESQNPADDDAAVPGPSQPVTPVTVPAASASLTSADAGAPDASPDGHVTEDGPTDVEDAGAGDGDELEALKEQVRILEQKLDEERKAGESSRKDVESVKDKVKELSEAIQFSGFFDVSASTYRNNPNVFELGSFEFDIAKQFGKHFQVGAALVFADKEAELAVGFIDFHLLGGLIPARGNVFLESGLHLQVGRFDVNIGNDWQYYASPDRPTMSAPLTTEVLMEGGYNDVGLRVLGNKSFINYAGYVLKGAGEGVAVGGRLALVPFSNPYTLETMENQPLDIGFGYLEDLSQDGTTEQRTFVTDFEARFEFLRLQAEYYWRRDHLEALLRKGYQVSLFGTFLDDGPLPFGVSGRFDQVHSTADDGTLDETLRRLTLACFFRPFEVTVIKLEFFRFLDGNEDMHGNSVFAQLVIGFK